MVITYFDESGDDGYPKASSPLFVMSCIYMTDDKWKENHDRVYKFRRYLAKTCGFSVRDEFHTRQFILNKKPYHGKFSTKQRKDILNLYFRLIHALEIKIINVVIDKERAKRSGKGKEYNVLSEAFKYAIQRLENDMKKSLNNSNFVIITDEGRVNAMRSISRKIQRFNYIPSMFEPSAYRSEVERLIEDPLPKNSKDSFFVQLADTMAYITYLYTMRNLCDPPLPWTNKIKAFFRPGDELALLDGILNRLNTKASTKNKYGVVYYPK